MTKIAIASTDGININAHFGSAKEFLLYEVYETGEYKFIERRATTLTQTVGESHGSAEQNADLLQDVSTVLVGQIGPKAIRILESKGIKSFALESLQIDKALRTFGKKSNLIKNLSVNSAHCAPSTEGCSGGCSSGCNSSGCK